MGRKKVTQAQANKVLLEVAKFLGPKMGYEGPAPTGALAACKAEGPELNMSWDWPGQPTPTILLEGGPFDWAIEAAWEVKVPGLFLEPYAGYALCIYRED